MSPCLQAKFHTSYHSHALLNAYIKHGQWTQVLATNPLHVKLKAVEAVLLVVHLNCSLL